jgi:hypothetical protein
LNPLSRRPAIDYLRQTLVAVDVLPEREEELAQTQLLL